jgi:hypothetical protein
MEKAWFDDALKNTIRANPLFLRVDDVLEFQLKRGAVIDVIADKAEREIDDVTDSDTVYALMAASATAIRSQTARGTMCLTKLAIALKPGSFASCALAHFGVRWGQLPRLKCVSS